MANAPIITALYEAAYQPLSFARSGFCAPKFWPTKVCAALPQPRPTNRAMVSSRKTMPSAVVALWSVGLVNARATSECVTNMAKMPHD